MRPSPAVAVTSWVAKVDQGLDEEAQDSGGTLHAAVELARAQRERYEALLEDVRRVRREHSTRLHDAEKQLQEIAARIEQVKPAPGGDVENRQALELLPLREHQEVLRQQQAWLAERLVALASDARKLQVVIRQAELIASYLEGGPGGGDVNDGPLSGLVQLRALQGREEERQRIARDIHDGPAQVFANAIFELEFCQRLLVKDPQRLEAEMIRVKGNLREGLAEVRQFIFDLRPGPLAELGLAATIRSYAESFQARFGIKATVELDDSLGRLSPSCEMGVFRILQEALQNVRKHSGAANVRIELRQDSASVVVVVEDDGHGFDVTAVERAKGHYGLESMQERARLLRGELHIDSRPGQGTRVMLDVPNNHGTDL